MECESGLGVRSVRVLGMSCTSSGGKEPKRWDRGGEGGRIGFNNLMGGTLYFIIEHLWVVQIYCWSSFLACNVCNHSLCSLCFPSSGFRICPYLYRASSIHLRRSPTNVSVQIATHYIYG